MNKYECIKEVHINGEIPDVSWDLEKTGSLVTAMIEGILTWRRAIVNSVFFAALTFVDSEFVSILPRLRELSSITPIVLLILPLQVAIGASSLMIKEGCTRPHILHYVAGFSMGLVLYMLIGHIVWPLSLRGLIVVYFSFLSLQIAIFVVGKLLIPLNKRSKRNRIRRTRNGN